MDDAEWGGWVARAGIGGFFVGAITILLLSFFGDWSNAWKGQAVKQGHAEYYLDENNERQWRWKDCGHEGEEDK